MEFDELSGRVIGCAIRIHKRIGPGMLESFYQKCMEIEFQNEGLEYVSQPILKAKYEGVEIGDSFRPDLIVENKMIVELKAVEHILNVHSAQLLTYLKLTGNQVGLLINLNEVLLKDGIRRLVNDNKKIENERSTKER
jgi:GxxExxY protein